MTDWDTFWRFFGQTGLILLVWLIVWGVILEIKKANKKD